MPDLRLMFAGFLGRRKPGTSSNGEERQETKCRVASGEIKSGSKTVHVTVKAVMVYSRVLCSGVQAPGANQSSKHRIL